MYDEEKFAQLEQSQESSRGEFIYGASELLLDPYTIVFGVLAFFVMGVYAVVRLILETFLSGGPPQGLFGDHWRHLRLTVTASSPAPTPV